MPRTAAEESERLHRAKRAAELRDRDAALVAADTVLANLKMGAAKALLAVMRGRPEAPEMVAALAAGIERARLVLRDYFDNPQQGDDDGP